MVDGSRDTMQVGWLYGLFALVVLVPQSSPLLVESEVELLVASSALELLPPDLLAMDTVDSLTSTETESQTSSRDSVDMVLTDHTMVATAHTLLTVAMVAMVPTLITTNHGNESKDIHANLCFHANFYFEARGNFKSSPIKSPTD